MDIRVVLSNNVGALVQWKHLQRLVVTGGVWNRKRAISGTGQDRTNVDIDH